MTLKRGDVVMTRFPHAGGNRGKKRPAVVIQADSYNSKLKHFILAEVTRNLAAGSDPASFIIDVTTAEGKATGLDHLLDTYVARGCTGVQSAGPSHGPATRPQRTGPLYQS